MLSSHDSELCGRDPAIRGLETLLDPELLGLEVARAGRSLPITHFIPSYLRYKPGTNCIVGFSSPNSPRTIAFYGKAYSRDTGKPKKSSPVDSSRGRIILDSQGIELFIFPSDARLDLRNAQQGNPPSQGRLDGHDEGFGTALVPSITTLAYRPERRCVFAKNAGEDNGEVIKAYSPKEFSRTWSGARAFKNSGSSLFPALLSADEDSRHLIFPWSPGEQLQQSLEQDCASLACFVRAGEQLAAVHHVDVEALPFRSNAEEADHLIQTAAMIGRVCPDLSDASAAAAKKIAWQLLKMPCGSSTLHGDFGAKQVISSGQSVAFLDYDEAARGNPAADLGNFIARLEADALLGIIRTELVAPVQAALLGGYESAARLPPQAELRLYTCVGLFRAALEPFRRHDPEWPLGMRRFINHVNSVLEGCVDPGAIEAEHTVRLASQ